MRAEDEVDARAGPLELVGLAVVPLVEVAGAGNDVATGMFAEVSQTLPLTGDQRRVVVGQRQATLITNGEQREVVFDVPSGSLFVYGTGFGEDELLRVAGSLEPIDVQQLRTRVGTS